MYRVQSIKLPLICLSDDARSVIPVGKIDACGYGWITCRLCRQFGQMPSYCASWGSQFHYFGLHDSCAKAYFYRIKMGDLIALIEIVHLNEMGGQKWPKQIFSM